MQILVPVDIEDALRVDLADLYERLGITGVDFSAMPVPATLGDLPATRTLVTIRRVGGSRTSLVVDTHAVSLDVYAGTWAESIAEANRLAGVLCSLPRVDDLSITYHEVEITNQPVELPDTTDPVLPRVRLSASVSVKSDIIEMS
jgi:hypothetical protein